MGSEAPEDRLTAQEKAARVDANKAATNRGEDAQTLKREIATLERANLKAREDFRMVMSLTKDIFSSSPLGKQLQEQELEVERLHRELQMTRSSIERGKREEAQLRGQIDRLLNERAAAAASDAPKKAQRQPKSARTAAETTVSSRSCSEHTSDARQVEPRPETMDAPSAESPTCDDDASLLEPPPPLPVCSSVGPTRMLPAIGSSKMMQLVGYSSVLREQRQPRNWTLHPCALG